jgi:hypothetical protein
LPVGSSASTQAGRGDDGARDRGALALAAGQFGRMMVTRCGQSDRRQRFGVRRRAPRQRCAPDRQRQRDVVERGELGQQMMELVDEAEPLVAQLAALGLAEPRDVLRPSIRTWPRSAASSPPSTCSSVLLPEPDAPTIATSSPV